MTEKYGCDQCGEECKTEEIENAGGWHTSACCGADITEIHVYMCGDCGEEQEVHPEWLIETKCQACGRYGNWQIGY